MWIAKEKYQKMLNKIAELEDKVAEFEDDSGEALIHRLSKLAKLAKIDVYSEEYQTMMARVFMDIGGRDSRVLKAYSGTAFMKDNPEEILTRLKKFQRDASIITKKLEKDEAKKK